MTQATCDGLEDINARFAEADEPQFNDYSDLVGDHILRIDRCALETSQNFKRMLIWEYVIVTTEKVGREFIDRNMLETAQNMGWLKVRLRQRGVQVDDPKFDLAQFLVNGTGVMIKELVRASIVEGKPSQDGRKNFNLRDAGDPKTLGSAIVTDADVAAWGGGGSTPPAAPATAGNVAAEADATPNPFA